MIGEPDAFAAVGTEESQKQSSDRVGRPAAVVKQMFPVAIPVDANVLREGIEQCAQLIDRKRVLIDERIESRHHLGRLWRRLAECLIELCETCQAFGVCEITFIRQIVGKPGEVIERDDRWADRARHQDRRHRKVFVMLNRRPGSGMHGRRL